MILGRKLSFYNLGISLPGIWWEFFFCYYPHDVIMHKASMSKKTRTICVCAKIWYTFLQPTCILFSDHQCQIITSIYGSFLSSLRVLHILRTLRKSLGYKSRILYFLKILHCSMRSTWKWLKKMVNFLEKVNFY